MRIVKEEIFGPVVAVIKFKDEVDLIEMANDTIYGLAAGVFTQNVSRAIRVAGQLQAGMVWVNCYNKVHSQVPFGGCKQSGIGREVSHFLARSKKKKRLCPPPAVILLLICTCLGLLRWENTL